MIELLRLILHIVTSLFKPRAKLVAEILVLRQQLNVLRRQVSKRPQLSNADRLLFVWLCRWFPSVLRANLRHQPIMARQDNLAPVEAWQPVPIQIALRLLAQFVADAVLAEWLLHELAAVVVTNHFGNVVGLEQLGEFVNDDRRTEWGPH